MLTARSAPLGLSLDNPLAPVTLGHAMGRFILLLFILCCAAASPCEAGSLRHDAYVWQRAWTSPVTNAVTSLASNFGELIVLQAEVTWRQGAPRCVRVDLDYEALRASGRPVGLALRIGSFPGPFEPDSPETLYLADLSRALVREARANHLRPTELQLDYDCAESKLNGYRVWLAAIQRAVESIPVSITALPSWLNRSAFKKLASEADGYVLQVHSFERPRSSDGPLTLCDPRLARGAVAKAARIGEPFRVALPTYGYVVAFDAKGALLGLSAEGPARGWPETAKVVEVRANPFELSALVREWANERPRELQGLIWYRLPVAGDVLNWRWPTLATVMAGARPQARVRAYVRNAQPELVEIDLANDGTADAERLPRVTVRWSRGRKVAADGIQGYEDVEDPSGGIDFRPVEIEHRLAAGERKTIGWIRFEEEAEASAECHDISK